VHAELHVRVRPDLPRARYGSGAVHHLALRVSNGAPMEEWASHLAELGYVNSGVVERYYFTSVYVREPNHVLIELATDGPGFQVDGPLGMERLKLPPFLEGRREQIESGLKPLH
jgi:glyoxalase family protein